MATQRDDERFDASSMTDDEVRSVVVEHLRENSGLDADWIDVHVRNGFVTLSGRVGSDAEIQVAAMLLRDVLGIATYRNDLVVDELHRGTLSDAADEAATEVSELDESVRGTRDQQTDTADHLVENLRDETFGTRDMDTAIRSGTSYSPPEDPRPDGYDSRENH